MNYWMTLESVLYAIAIDGLREANRNNPFISKSEAMKFINQFN